MKAMLPALSVLMLSACATAIPYTPKESCAFQDMKLTSVSHSNFDGHSGLRSDGGEFHDFTCGPAETDADRCEIDRARKSAAPKLEYNENIGSKRLVTGLGYAAFIVPGVVAKVLYDDQESDALKRSQEMQSAIPTCSLPRIPASH